MQDLQRQYSVYGIRYFLILQIASVVVISVSDQCVSPAQCYV